MVTDAALNEIREDLKRRLAAGEFRTLIDILLDGIGRVVRMITRHPRPISLWYSSTILFLVIVLIGFGAMLLAGEAAVINTVVATSPIGLLALGGYLAVASMVARNAYVHRVFVAFGDRILDTVESTASVHDFERWLAAVCNWPVHLIFCLVAGVLGGSYLMYIASANLGLSIGVGFALAGLLLSACSAAFMYLLIHMVALSARVGRYQLKLY